MQATDWFFSKVIIDGFEAQKRKVDGMNGANSTKSNDSNCALLLLSAETDLALKAQTQTLREFAAKNPSRSSELAYTRALHRRVLSHKAFALLQDGIFSEEFSGLKSSRSVAPKIVMVFTGQGAQWAGMGRELTQKHAAFRQDLEAMEATLNMLTCPPEWSLTGKYKSYH